ncbi:hypothetical protein ABB37_08462 [Leptomonas pyrrhocoris]|uniref:Uncharacterized protein n=1 Tax=Leptomonas pyrrhocoris TaxID=157538 RepID=A0A0M9FT71_LEPPY|nr:hypothetical protein ABB37_08462 [Leptomonas pyrrhocoris]XP_015654020.1 hypothetical protein ABB37_08462 [Leptomonas pyrrhocoris]KPA75580.1 hypothetical protein ABB37_08462 [Leptomonas pyrrhocoris]KPA75581.1 hypothetical protein ABB37_08462 [Leptomonas pyrrhocoris]|eukprot:XP_015654019.1 hypothetical protein ABB37_08462 [Leptomonas pyrrhocoris]
MGEPLVVSVSASAAGSSAKALSYVALRSHDGKRVILPVAAAAGSRVLHGLFQGLSVMQLHQSAAAGAETVSDDAVLSASAPTPLDATLKAKSEELTSGAPTAAESLPVIEDDEDGAGEPYVQEEGKRPAEEGGGAAFCSYAAAFPANVVCQPPSAFSSSLFLASSNLLEVPIRALESTTLARVAEFLVVKCTLASHPHYLHEADVFGDLDRTSERDQLTAMQVLLGADFLNC